LKDAVEDGFVGTPDEIVEQMRGWAKLGVELFMLQHFLLDDRDSLELLAREVISAIA
jgi:alkanesulfonate monooxygenase SsuD/methylene tetrahydromethanopterin reductase-like flavin-dependent oxidoreductase (luciferase family)